MGSGGGNDGVMERMSGNTVTTVMAFAVSAMFVLFVFTRLFCARLRLGGAAAAFGASGDGFSTTVERGIHGLEPSVVASFPTLKFGDGLRRQPAQEGSHEEILFFLKVSITKTLQLRFIDGRCSVCLEEYEDKDLVRVLPYCGHAFHVACIDVWLKQHSTCPICRVPLRASPRTKRAMPSTVHTGSTTAPFFLQSSASSSEPVSPLQTAAAASDRSEANAAAHEIGHEPVVSSNDSSSASAAAV